RPIVVSDTVFSMDGRVADVSALHELACRHDAWLVLDEAHATGVVGPGGRGAAAEAGLDPGDGRVVRIVTLSKALGAAGGAVPPGTSRLRLVPTAAHADADVDGVAAAVRAALERS